MTNQCAAARNRERHLLSSNGATCLLGKDISVLGATGFICYCFIMLAEVEFNQTWEEVVHTCPQGIR